MSVVRGRGVKIEVASTFGAAFAVLAVSLAHNAVVAATAHGQSEYAVGYFDDVRGMIELEGQAAQVMGPIPNAFLCRGLDTTGYENYIGGTFIPVTAWLTLGEATSYSLVIDEPIVIDRTTILDKRGRVEYGLRGTERITCNLLAQTAPSDARLLIERASRAHDHVVLRITHPDGATRVARAIPSAPGEDVQQGAIGTGSVSFLVNGTVVYVPSEAVTPPSQPVQNYVEASYCASDYVQDSTYAEDYVL